LEKQLARRNEQKEATAKSSKNAEIQVQKHTPVAADSKDAQTSRNPTKIEARMSGSPKKDLLEKVDISSPHTPTMNKHLNNREEERYTNFVREFEISGVFSKTELSLLESQIKKVLRSFEVSVYIIASHEKKLRDKMRRSAHDTFGASKILDEILENGVQSPIVFRPDRELEIQKHTSELEEQRRTTEKLLKDKKVDDGVRDVLKRSAILPGWGQNLTDQGESLKAKIKDIITKAYNKEFVHPVEDPRDPFKTFIALLSKKDTEEGVNEAISKFLGKQWLKAKERNAEREASALKLVIVEEKWDYFPSLTSTSHVDMSNVNAHSIMKLHDKAHDAVQKFFALMSKPQATGLTILPFKESEQVHINLKAHSLIKTAGEARSNVLKLKTSFSFEPRYYKDNVNPATATELNRLIHTENYMLWVLTSDVTNVIYHYFFAIHQDTTKPVVSLTLNQGNPNLTGRITKLIRKSKELMKASLTTVHSNGEV